LQIVPATSQGMAWKKLAECLRTAETLMRELSDLSSALHDAMAPSKVTDNEGGF
jgi:hypothetical protein